MKRNAIEPDSLIASFMISAVFISIPILLLLIALEILWGHRRGMATHRFVDTVTNFNIGAIGQIFAPLAGAASMGVYVLVYQHLALFEHPDSWWMLAPCLLLYDFLYYWAHRWGHTVNLWWGAHVVHHSSDRYNLTTSFRQAWLHRLLAFPIFVPMPLLGFRPGVFLAAAAIVALHQFWIHTKLIGRLPRAIELVFNCPSHHRVHHAVNPQYIDRNFGGMLIVWDRLLGTFAEEQETPRYGLVQPLRSSNPVWANAHVYVDLVARMRTTPRGIDKLRLWMVSPRALTKPTRPSPARLRQPRPSPALRLYVVAQCLVIAAGMFVLVHAHAQIGLGGTVTLGACTVWAAVACGGLLDGRGWAWRHETLRLLATAATIIVLCAALGLAPLSWAIAVASIAWLVSTAAFVTIRELPRAATTDGVFAGAARALRPAARAMPRKPAWRTPITARRPATARRVRPLFALQRARVGRQRSAASARSCSATFALTRSNRFRRCADARVRSTSSSALSTRAMSRQGIERSSRSTSSIRSSGGRLSRIL